LLRRRQRQMCIRDSLKCDIRKFFASVDQSKLLDILTQYIPDKDIISLIAEIIGSFSSIGKGTGLPLGNLTSQLLVNVYMNEFDQFVKHKIKAKYYIRYADDFVIMHHEKSVLVDILLKIQSFLSKKLKLSLHPEKISIKTFSSGIDFLGWVHFPKHRLLRTSTKRRMMKNLKINSRPASLASYRGMLKHGNTFKLRRSLSLLIN
jgi:RNA-directed DNA polymerase